MPCVSATWGKHAQRMGERRRLVCPNNEYCLVVTHHANRYKHMGSYIMDGNFSAQHMQMKKPLDDVHLADGHGFMVTDGPYKNHLKTAAKLPRQVRK